MGISNISRLEAVVSRSGAVSLLRQMSSKERAEAGIIRQLPHRFTNGVPLPAHNYTAALPRELMAKKYELSATLLGQECGPESAIKLLDGLSQWLYSNLVEFDQRVPREFTQGEGRYTSIQDSLSLFGTDLYALREFYKNGETFASANNVQKTFGRAFSEGWVPPREIAPNGYMAKTLELMSSADPVWMKFAFSISPLLKDLDPRRLINSSIPKSVTTITYQLEQILFWAFLRPLFIYPVFTDACEPFVCNIAEGVKKFPLVESVIESIRVDFDDESKILAGAADIFSCIRMNLSAASMLSKIALAKTREKAAGENASMKELHEYMVMASSHYFVVKDLLAMAHLMELTEAGKRFVDSESFALEEIEARLKERADLAKALS